MLIFANLRIFSGIRKCQRKTSRPFVLKWGRCSTELKFRSFEKEKSITMRSVAQSYGRYDLNENMLLKICDLSFFYICVCFNVILI